MVDVKQLKETLGERAKDIIANDLGLNFNKSGFSKCPFHTEETPSFKWYDKGYFFKCFGGCDNYDIIDHYTQHLGLSMKEAIEKLASLVGVSIERPAERKPIKKTFKTPEEKVYDFFKSRGIKKETVDFWRTGIKTIDFAKKGEPKELKKAIVFPCYDENDVLVHETYRSSTKQIKQNFGTPAILYGMWHINTTKPLCICEGQLDAMSIWQSGFKNVVSVSSGASNYTFLTENIEWLEQFPDVIVWADNDEAGEKLASVIKSKLKNVRIIKGGERKDDANALLLRSGEKAVLDFINKEPELPNNMISFSDLSYSNEDAPEEDRFETGFRELDEHVEDIRVEEFTLLVGRDGEGKSTFISQLLVHRLLKEQKTFLFSAELGEQAIQDWVFKQLIGNDQSCYEKKSSKYGPKYFLKKENVVAIKKWIGNKLIMLDRREKLTCNELIDRMRILAVRNGVKLFIIDNLQSALVENASSLYSDQSNFAEDLRMFAITHKVAVLLVVHPRKVEELDTAKGDVDTGNITKDDISGSKNMSNKAHNIISIERDFESRYFDMILTLLKDKRTKGRKSFKYKFDENSFRYYSDKTPSKISQPWRGFLKPVEREVKYYNGTKQTFKNDEFDDLLF